MTTYCGHLRIIIESAYLESAGIVAETDWMALTVFRFQKKSKLSRAMFLWHSATQEHNNGVVNQCARWTELILCCLASFCMLAEWKLEFSPPVLLGIRSLSLAALE